MIFLKFALTVPAIDPNCGRSPFMPARLAGPNPLDPDRMTPEERLAEIGRILGAALVRLNTGQSRSLSEDHGESCLDLPPANAVMSKESK